MRLHCLVDSIHAGQSFHDMSAKNRLQLRITPPHGHATTLYVIDDGTYKLGDEFDLVAAPCEKEPEHPF